MNKSARRRKFSGKTKKASYIVIRVKKKHDARLYFQKKHKERLKKRELLKYKKKYIKKTSRIDKKVSYIKNKRKTKFKRKKTLFK